MALITEVFEKQVKAKHFSVTVIFAYEYREQRKVNCHRIGVLTQDNLFYE